MMSDTSIHYLSVRQFTPRWGWCVTLGIVLLVAGALACVDTAVTTLLSVFVIGLILIAAGIGQILHAFVNRAWDVFIFSLLCGALQVVGGLLIMDEPVRGSLVITAVLMVVLGVAGVLRVILGLRHRNVRGWWLLVLTGFLTMILAMLLCVSLPWSSLWLLGTIIAFELIFHGAAWISFGLALHRG